MFWCGVFISFVAAVSGYRFSELDHKCAHIDFPCIGDLFRQFLNESLPGIEEIGASPLDPLHIALIEEKKPNLDVTLTDSIAKGFKNLILNNLLITKEGDKIIMHFDTTAPNFEMSGTYKAHGKVINLPVTGEGKYTIKATNLHTKTTAQKFYYKKEGIKYLKLINIKTDTEFLGALEFDIENLFNGNKELAEPVLKFIKDNPKSIAGMLQDTVGLRLMQAMFDDYNKILEATPIEDIVDYGDDVPIV